MAIPRKLLAAVLAFATAAPGFAHQDETGEIRLGYLDTIYGLRITVAMADQVRELNDKGGVNGRKVRLIVYDSSVDADQVMADARRLVEQDHVAGVIGPGFSAAAVRVGPLAEGAKIPFVATLASDPKVTVDLNGRVQPYLFRACFTDLHQAKVLADFAYHDLGKRRAAFILDEGYDNSMSILQAFTAEFTHLGGSVVAKAGFAEGATDFRGQVAQVVKAGPDCLVLAVLHHEDIAQIVQQADSMSLKLQYLGLDTMSVNESLAATVKGLDGCYATSGLAADDPRFADFNARFFHDHLLQAGTKTYYTLDALLAMEYALKASLDRTREVDPEAMREALEHLRDVPVFTGRMTMDPATHDPRDLPVVIVTVKDGRWRTWKTYKPE